MPRQLFASKTCEYLFNEETVKLYCNIVNVQNVRCLRKLKIYMEFRAEKYEAVRDLEVRWIFEGKDQECAYNKMISEEMLDFKKKLI